MDSDCPACGTELATDSPKCPACGQIQPSFVYKSRIAAAALAIFGGSFGAHRFFLGQWWGIFYLLFCWTYIPSLIGLVEGLVFLSTSQQSWNQKYNQDISSGSEKGTVVVILALIFPTLAIIGIVAAIALPAYQDYTIRAKLNEAHLTAETIMEAVELYANRKNDWPDSVYDIGIRGDSSNPYINSIEINEGIIYVQVSEESGASGEIIYVPTAGATGISWSCTESTVASQYLPQTCRP